jgi:hypothetical protein
MAPLLKELSNLEVEPLQIVEHEPASEQESSLETLTTLDDVDIAALLTGQIPTNDKNCCCCCPVCCCLCMCC